MKSCACLLIGALLLPACEGMEVHLETQAPATWHLEPGGHESAEVTRVIDGDTIEVTVTESVAGPGTGEAVVGRSYDVRLLGIDTPESVDPRREVQCFGHEAAAAARALLEGHEVRMVVDVEEADSFGRLLRYVYLGDELANARLVVNGYAYAYTFPPNVRHAELFVSLQAAARSADGGLWSPSACAGRR